MTSYFIKKHIEMTMVVSMCFLLFIFSRCVSTQHNYDAPNAVLAYNLPIVKLDGELNNLTDSIFIFRQKETVILQLPYPHITELLNGGLKKEMKYNYFSYTKNSANGLYYDIDSSRGRQVTVDSMLKAKTFAGFIFFNTENDSLLEATTQQHNKKIEKYLTKLKIDESYPDTLLLYYSANFKNVDYSFSIFLDSKGSLKIHKVRMLYNEQISPKYSFKLPKREFWFELKEVNTYTEKEMTQLFERFKPN